MRFFGTRNFVLRQGLDGRGGLGKTRASPHPPPVVFWGGVEIRQVGGIPFFAGQQWFPVCFTGINDIIRFFGQWIFHFGRTKSNIIVY